MSLFQVVLEQRPLRLWSATWEWQSLLHQLHMKLGAADVVMGLFFQRVLFSSTAWLNLASPHCWLSYSRSQLLANSSQFSTSLSSNFKSLSQKSLKQMWVTDPRIPGWAKSPVLLGVQDSTQKGVEDTCIVDCHVGVDGQCGPLAAPKLYTVWLYVYPMAMLTSRFWLVRMCSNILSFL